MSSKAQGTVRRTRMLGLLAGLIALVAPVALAASAPADAANRAPASGPQREIDDYLRAHPGGEQISDHAVAYRNGEVVVVFPDPEARVAPAGLGLNVRSTDLALDVSADIEVATSSVQGCPSGSVDDWYCFYTDPYFGGRRLQFLNTCADWASNWGFNNTTSSWVNTNPRSQIVAWDYAGGQVLWVEPTGVSSDSWVGSSVNDRLSYWTRTNC